MIVINKDDDSTILILSQLDKQYDSFTLKLNSGYTKKEYIIDLGINYSENSSRYTKFEILKSMVDSLSTGEYEFQFLADADVITFGLLVIESATDEVVYESIVPPAEDDDFYVVKTN